MSKRQKWEHMDRGQEDGWCRAMVRRLGFILGAVEQAMENLEERGQRSQGGQVLPT